MDCSLQIPSLIPPRNAAAISVCQSAIGLKKADKVGRVGSFWRVGDAACNAQAVRAVGRKQRDRGEPPLQEGRWSHGTAVSANVAHSFLTPARPSLCVLRTRFPAFLGCRCPKRGRKSISSRRIPPDHVDCGLSTVDFRSEKNNRRGESTHDAKQTHRVCPGVAFLVKKLSRGQSPIRTIAIYLGLCQLPTSHHQS